MKLAAYKIGEDKRIGLVPNGINGKMFDLAGMFNGSRDLISIIESDTAVETLKDLNERIANDETLRNELIDVNEIEFLAPVERPGKIVCLAGNYGEHIVESGYVEPGERARFTQQLFLKPATSLTGNGGVIEFGEQNVRAGWETELAVVIGKRGKNIKAENAYDHIFGLHLEDDRLYGESRRDGPLHHRDLGMRRRNAGHLSRDVGELQLVRTVRMLEEVEDPLLLHQPRDEGEVALAVLRAVVARLVRAVQRQGR